MIFFTTVAALALVLDAASAIAQNTDKYEARSISGAYLAGRVASGFNDMASASRFYAKALAADPSDVALQRRAFQAHLAAGEIGDALKLAEGLAKEPEGANLARVALAAAAAKHGDFAAAKRQIELLAEEGADRLVRPVLLAWIELGLGSIEKAVEALRALVGVDGLSVFQELHLALILDAGGRTAQAEAAYRALLERQSTPPLRIVQATASFYARNGKQADAQRILEKQRGQQPDSSLVDFALKRLSEGKAPSRPVARPTDGMAELLVNLSGALQQENALDAALIYARLGEYLRPNDPDTLYVIGGLLESEEQLEAAIEIYRRVPRESDVSWSARRAAAAALGQLKRFDEAERLFEEMARERPERWDALMLLGTLHRSEKRYEKAVDAYDRAVMRIAKLEERHWNLLYARGIALERAKRWPLAEADFKKALELKPNEPYVLNYLGYTWVDRGEHLDEAKAMLESAVKLKPDDGAIVDSVGWAYYRLGQFDTALDHLERAVELNPEDPTINDHLGDVYWRVGRRAEARFQWHRALSLNPEPDDAPQMREKIEHGMKPFEGVGKKP